MKPKPTYKWRVFFQSQEIETKSSNPQVAVMMACEQWGDDIVSYVEPIKEKMNK